MTPSEELRRPYRYLAILALALVAYWPVFHVGFLWDDHVTIEANPALREWSFRALKHDFTTDVFDGHGDPYYRPAATLLSRVDYSLWGLRPLGYHVTNWMGHAMNALLLQEIVMSLGFGNLIALLVGCLFAVNPIAVEQLMIVSGRAEIYGFTFILLTFLLLLRNEKENWLLGYAAYAVALLFKESALIAPTLLACLYAYKKLKPSAYQRLIPLFILIVPYLMLRHHVVGALVPDLRIRYLAKFYIEAFPKVLLIYARLVLIPWNLHSHRLMPHLSHAWPFLLALVVGSAAFLIRKKSSLGLLSLAWFVLMLLPKTPIMIFGNFMLDHWAYAASFGIFLPLAVGYARLWKGPHTPVRYWLGMSLFPLLIFWALMVRLNVALRGTDETMYRWALHFTTSNPIKFNLGVLLLQTGRPVEALQYFLEFQSAYPDNPQVKVALAQAYRQIGIDRKWHQHR